MDHNKLYKILKEMGISDHLTCLLRNLYAGQKATVRTGHGTTNWFQIGKGVCQGCILSPCLFNLYEEHIMRNAGLKEAQAGIKIAGSAGSYGSSISRFLRNLHTNSIVAVLVCIPTNSVRGFPFLHTLCSIYCL